MANEFQIMRNGVRVPVVAFFGTKGGVGKTTIARRFAELVTLAETAPDVLLVDADVHHRGMTVEMTSHTPVSCKTVHDYIASQNTSSVEAVNLTGLVKGARDDSGQLFFIPASAPESALVFEKSAKIDPAKLLETLHAVISSAVATRGCSCVVIDCGPIIDPYTAAAAMLADRAFIIGQNEPISFSSLKTYPDRIRDFYPEFTTAKMKVIINKVRGWERLEERKLQEDIFAAIPFTMDVVDVSEGLEASNQMQLMLFEDQIVQIVEKVFKADHKELIPSREKLLPQQWHSLIQNAERLEHAPPLKRLRLLRLLLPVGLLLVAAGALLFYLSSTQRHRDERAAQAQELAAELRREAAEAERASNPSAEPLRAALRSAEQVNPADGPSLEQALKDAQAAGLRSVPPLRRQDTTRENTGIGILLVGVVLGAVGYSCSRTEKNYLSALRGLRNGGAQWLMSEMKSKQGARRTFDKLLRMTR